MPQAHAQSQVRILLVALALGWCTDFFFYDKLVGISVPVFVLLMLGGLFWLGRSEGVRSVRRNLWLIVPLLFFATMVFVRANATLTWLNLSAVFVLLTLIVFFYASNRVERLGLFGYPVVLLLSVLNTLVLPTPAVATLAREAASRRERTRMVGPVLRGILLAVPLLLLFGLLLSSADTIFGGFLGDFFRVNIFEHLPETLWRQILILGAAWLIAGAFFYALARRHAPPDEPLGNFTPRRGLGFVEAAVVLGLVDALFAVFAWFQFTYLFFGQAARTLHYEEYREYVRRGFGELLVAAVLTMALILGLRWIAWKETGREARIFNWLSTLMIALTGVMLVSAFERMLMWESVQFYINTPLRLYVRSFIIWLGITFAWLLYTLWYRQDRFAIGAVMATMGFLITINMLNPDADVAAYNLARNDDLSTRYLYLLSDDAVPVLVAGLDHTTGYVHTALVDHLTQRLDAMEHDPTRDGWPAFHLSRWQAHELLSDLRKAGVIHAPKPTGSRPDVRPAETIHPWRAATVN
jgi:hypothetical protein